MRSDLVSICQQDAVQDLQDHVTDPSRCMTASTTHTHPATYTHVHVLLLDTDTIHLAFLPYTYLTIPYHTIPYHIYTYHTNPFFAPLSFLRLLKPFIFLVSDGIFVASSQI